MKTIDGVSRARTQPTVSADGKDERGQNGIPERPLLTIPRED